MTYLKQSAERVDGDAMEKVATYILLAYCCNHCDQQPDSITYFDRAYNMQPNVDLEVYAKDQEEIKELQIIILVEKTSAFSMMTMTEYALEMFNKARALHGEEFLLGSRLDDITLLFSEETDPDGTKLMDTLKDWTDRERYNWFS